MTTEVKENFDLEAFRVEFDYKIEQFRDAYNKFSLVYYGNSSLSDKEEAFLTENKERHYRELIGFLTSAYRESGGSQEVMKSVIELMNLWEAPDNDIPVFLDKGLEVMQDFTQELLSEKASSPVSDSRKSLKAVLGGDDS